MRNLIFTLLLWSLPLFNLSMAQELRGEGNGPTQELAKKEALASLSQSIAVQVQSVQTQMEQLVNDRYQQDATSIIRVESKLPLLGAETFVLEDVNDFSATALLTATDALPLYRAKLEGLQREIEQAQRQLAQTQRNTEREPLLQELLAHLEEFKRHLTVLLVLGERNLPEMNLTETEVRSQLRQAQTNPDSLEQAARLLTETMQEHSSIYVFPFKAGNSQEVTPFAAALQGRLQQQLSTVSLPNRAQLWLHGSYVVQEQGLELSAHLIQVDTHEAVVSRALFLPSIAYEGLRAQPSQLSFEEQLRNNPDLWKTNEFQVQIKTNKGGEELLFREGELFELFVKLNKPGYFYIVGHTFAEEPAFSYLLDLNRESEAPRKFVRFVNSDDANKWVSLGEFEIAPPLGLENLQVIAANEDLEKRLPPHSYDRNSEFYLVGSSPEQAVALTRAAKRPKQKKPQSYTAETVLTYTSLPKAE